VKTVLSRYRLDLVLPLGMVVFLLPCLFGKAVTIGSLTIACHAFWQWWLVLGFVVVGVVIVDEGWKAVTRDFRAKKYLQGTWGVLVYSGALVFFLIVVFTLARIALR
jgi:hypothetical protein